MPCDRYPESLKPEKIIQRYRDLVSENPPRSDDNTLEPIDLHLYYQNIRNMLSQAGTMIAPGCECPFYFTDPLFFREKHIYPLQKVIFENIHVYLPADPDMVLAGLFGDYMHYIGDGKDLE